MKDYWFPIFACIALPPWGVICYKVFGLNLTGVIFFVIVQFLGLCGLITYIVIDLRKGKKELAEIENLRDKTRALIGRVKLNN